MKAHNNRSLALVAVALLAGCAGGTEAELAASAAVRAMAMPQTAVVDMALCNPATLADDSYSLGADGQCRHAVPLLASASRARQPHGGVQRATGTLDADALFDWAERTRPALFPGHKPNLAVPPYVMRHYPETQMYLGVADGTVYARGLATGGVLVALGKLSEFNCAVYPGNCAGAAQPRPFI